MANDRRLKVLSAIVTDYVRTREPVGSKALVERYRLGVSPATIRNDMAALEDEGYIHQPHTSAGRVPVRALAQLTGQLAVVEYPSLRYAALQHLELVALGPERVLLVIITDTGRVDQRTVTLRSRGSLSSRHDGGFDIADVVDPLVLERLRTRLNGALTGRRAADVAPILAALAEQAPADERFLLEAVSDELVAALRPDAEERLVVAGTANLARATPDFSSLGPLLDAVEEQVVLLRLFTADNGAAIGENRMRVSIGSENNDDALAEASVVTTTYGPGTGEAVAHLGVIGPTRMDYPATMTAVRAVARYLSRFLSPPET